MQSNLAKERAMRKKRTRTMTICAAIAASAAVVAMPAAADAKKPAKPVAPKQAKFRATITGSQVTTWEYHRPDDKNNPCDASADGNGDQTIKFDAGGSFDLSFYQPTKKSPNVFGTHGRPAVIPGRIAVAGTAERNGDFAVHLSDIDQQKCDGQNGGGVDPGYVDPPKDCGKRSGIFRTDFFFNTELGDLGDLIPGGSRLDRDHLKLSGNEFEWRGLNGKRTANLNETYANCPFMLEDAHVEQTGQIFSSASRIKESKLFDKKRRKITISGSTIARRGGPNSTGQTIIAWNLRLTRVK
jgi:hypothetical protein